MNLRQHPNKMVDAGDETAANSGSGVRGEKGSCGGVCLKGAATNQRYWYLRTSRYCTAKFFPGTIIVDEIL
jgi:hypothetical protein